MMTEDEARFGDGCEERHPRPQNVVVLLKEIDALYQEVVRLEAVIKQRDQTINDLCAMMRQIADKGQSHDDGGVVA